MMLILAALVVISQIIRAEEDKTPLPLPDNPHYSRDTTSLKI
ncbi:MAG: hypothetical protein BMS9Abin28_0914 [Anaerolineae bacterium]|nr:MAG: hypothetical protein BMS9Abin28_0914 [Anaerolineae bacterium]